MAEQLGIENIIKGCKLGSIPSKERLYKQFYGYIMGVIIRYIFKSDEAEELVNDSFIKIFKNINSFESGLPEDEFIKAFKGWMARIASRTAIDHLRKNKHQFLLDDFDKTDYMIAAPIQSSLEIKDILSLLDNLPVNHKMVFNLYEMEGFSHDEIANLLKIPVSSSRVFLTRAKSKLRSLYVKQFCETR